MHGQTGGLLGDSLVTLGDSLVTHGSGVASLVTDLSARLWPASLSLMVTLVTVLNKAARFHDDLIHFYTW